MRSLNPDAERERACKAFEDLLQELGFDYTTCVGLIAAASAWAKAERAWAAAQFVEARKSDVVEHVR